MLDRYIFLAKQVSRDQRPVTRRRRKLVRKAVSMRELLEPPTPPRAGWHHRFAALIGEPDPGGPIWAVMMAQNEEVRVAGPVHHLAEQGVDVIVVVNNLSTDRTSEVLTDLARELPLVVVDDQVSGFYQGTTVSQLARAATRHGASWVVPVDADELWYGVGTSLAGALRASRAHVLPAQLWDHLPGRDSPDSANPYVDLIRRTVDPSTKHVAFRAHLLAGVHEGSHWVNRPGEVERGRLEARHFPYLGFDHFVSKLRRGAAALARTDLSPGTGTEWRAWGTADDAGVAEAWEFQMSRPTIIDPAPIGPGAVGNISLGASASGSV